MKTKWRIKTTTFGDGKKRYYIQKRGWIFWNDYITDSNYSFNCMEHALDKLAAIKQVELMCKIQGTTYHYPQ